ncbi:hypothetical protein [Ensifer aridi]|uniref:hypothetical protein n=1 Tax=Ensifer aridi TaxID=1708715 RepID=UPI00111C5C71|nr:hypothetical protein [Ensifer aridi]
MKNDLVKNHRFRFLVGDGDLGKRREREAGLRGSAMPPKGANLFLVKQRGCRDVQTSSQKDCERDGKFFRILRKVPLPLMKLA